MAAKLISSYEQTNVLGLVQALAAMLATGGGGTTTAGMGLSSMNPLVIAEQIARVVTSSDWGWDVARPLARPPHRRRPRRAEPGTELQCYAVPRQGTTVSAGPSLYIDGALYARDSPLYIMSPDCAAFESDLNTTARPAQLRSRRARAQAPRVPCPCWSAHCCRRLGAGDQKCEQSRAASSG